MRPVKSLTVRLKRSRAGRFPTPSFPALGLKLLIRSGYQTSLLLSNSIRAMICWSPSASWERARTGHHVIDGALKLKAGPFDYHGSVRQFDRPGEFLVYPIPLQRRLPTIRIPLQPGDPSIPISLQAVFQRAYDAGPYRRAVRYGTAKTRSIFH